MPAILVWKYLTKTAINTPQQIPFPRGLLRIFPPIL